LKWKWSCRRRRRGGEEEEEKEGVVHTRSFTLQ